MAICSIELWQSVMTDVVFVSEFNLSENYLAKANKYLASLKRRIMNIAYANENFESAFIEAQQLAFKYNIAINNLLAEVFEPIRTDFSRNVDTSNLVPIVPVKVESIEAMVSRLQEFMRLRIRDIDFHRGEIHIHSGKGNKDRILMLPKSIAKLTALAVLVSETLRLHRTSLRSFQYHIRNSH